MRILIASASVALSLGVLGFSSGCGSDAKYVENDKEKVVNTNKINVQDFNRAAAEMTTSLLNSDVLTKAPRKPAVMMVSRVRNDTNSNFDTDMLTKKIRVQLMQSGKVVTTTVMGVGGRAEDAGAKGAKDAQDFYADKHNEKPDVPDYTLSGKILEDQSRAGDTKQGTFTFQLSLTETKTGYAVWEEERQITKQGTRSSVGF